jgi:hypothetical protein
MANCATTAAVANAVSVEAIAAKAATIHVGAGVTVGLGTADL